MTQQVACSLSISKGSATHIILDLTFEDVHIMGSSEPEGQLQNQELSHFFWVVGKF